MVFGLFELLLVFMFRFAMSYQCVLSWFTMKLVHKRMLDIFHLHGLGAGIQRIAYPKHVFILLILMWKWFPIDLKACMTLKRNKP